MNPILTKLGKMAFFLVFTSFSVSLLAQQVPISGTVSDQAGNPLPGVNIVVEGDNVGTITEVDGKFSLAVPSTDAILVFTYIGYQTQRIPVANQSTLAVVMEESIFELEDLVVVGYGVQKKGDVTGTISSVDGEDIQNLPVPGSSQALQGRVAGVQVVRNGGAPGERGRIRIRGTGTINNADPLVVIDGFPTSAETMDDINPNDIESIEVLKDASASAIYGTRAANGVIIITTKKGELNQGMKFRVNAYTGISDAVKTVDVLDAPTLAALKREAYTNSGRDIPEIWEDPQFQVQRTDWQDELLDQGITQNLDISLRGGSKTSSYAISAAYYNEEGMIKNSFFERFSFRINSDHQAGERLKIGENLQLTRTNGNFLNTRSAQTGVYWSSIRFHPGLPVIDENGNYGTSQVSGEFGDINNPIFTVDTEDDQTTATRLLASVYGELEIAKGLKFRANFGVDGTITDRDEFLIIIDDQIRARDQNELNRRYTEEYSLLAEYFLTYNQLFGDKHVLNLVAGYTTQQFQHEFVATQRRDFPNESPDQRFLDAGNTITDSEGNRTEDGLVSVFARANYSYANRYLLTATFRADGSSRFAEGNRWGYFPAFSAGWRVSEERFWNIPFISNLKFTVGWGQLGNQDVARNQFLALIGSGRRYSFGGEEAIGAAQSRIPNEDITWETSEILDIGAEVSLWDNRVLANINYFIKDTKDMLLPVPVVGSIGRALVPDRNIGELRNQGLEIELGYKNTIGEFSYHVSANAAFIENEARSLNAPFLESPRYGRPNQEIARTLEGHPIAVFWGWRAEGIYQNEGEIANDPGIANDPRRENGLIQPGDVRFQDLDGNGIINDQDRTVIGDPHPDVTYGLQASASYKGFDLTLFFMGEAGKDIYNADRMQGLDASYPFNLYEDVTGRWNGEGTSNSIPRLTVDRNNLNHRTSDLFIENGGFMRLKNLTVGYTLPGQYSSRVGISRARFYVTGQNIFTITDYSGIDPELGYITQENNLQLGVDYAQYPQARTWIFGLTLDF